MESYPPLRRHVHLHPGNRIGYRPAPAPVVRVLTNRAFTLVELLTAIVVVGVGVSIYLHLFNSSLDLSETGRNHRIATDLAREYLEEIRTASHLMRWPELDGAEPGTLIALEPGNDVAHLAGPASPPEAVPRRLRAGERTDHYYSRFARRAYVRAPAGSQPWIEVLAEIVWSENGRQKAFALSTVLMRPGS